MTDSQDSQELQQREKVTGTKRTRDAEDEVDGPPAKRANVEHDTEDGHRHKQADLSECCRIEAIFRTRGGSNGTLLKVQSDEEVKLSVDFTGTDPENQASVFHLEACKGIAGHVLRYSVKDKNYYLRVYSEGRVRLRKLADFPTNDKYFFRIQPVGRIVGCPVFFKSLHTDEYLYCDEDGEAFMGKVASDSKRKPKDQRAWFCCHRNYLGSELVENASKNEQDLVDGGTEDSDNGNSEAPPGKGHPDVPDEENSKDPDKGEYQYPVHVYTGDEWGGGTDANVMITIFGEKGDSGEKTLDNSCNNFERRQKDSFTVTCATYLGRLTHIKIDHDNSGLAAAWFLDKVTVQDPTTGEAVDFSCKQWFSTGDDDGKISRELTRDDDKGTLNLGDTVRSEDEALAVDGPPGNNEYDTVDGRKADFSERCTIQAIIRTGPIISPGGSDGNLLKAQSDEEIKLSVDFTGTDTTDSQQSVFYLEARDGIRGFALRYSQKDDNFYLRVYSNSKVKLRKLAGFPTNNKYFFQRFGRSLGCPVAFKSLNTDEYLCCDEQGNASMKKVKTDSKGKPGDIQALFCVHTATQENDQDSEQVKNQGVV